MDPNLVEKKRKMVLESSDFQGLELGFCYENHFYATATSKPSSVAPDRLVIAAAFFFSGR